MKRIFIIAVAALVSAVGCKNTGNQNTSDMNTNEPLKEVSGRKNFGAARSPA